MSDRQQERSQLERDLARRPMDTDLRQRYAQLLQELADWAAAEEQYLLLVDARPDDAVPAIGAARCRSQQGREREALDLYAKAQGLENFEADPELQALWEKARRSGDHLRAIDGSADNVVSLVREDKPEIRFADVAGMDELKKTLRLQIIEPFRRPGLFARFKKKAGGGVLLYGPPGCGKTLMAKAIAGECSASFIAVGITDVLNLWMGESEGNLAALFEKARAEKPAVLFFDELDALAFARSKARSEHSRTVVNEFLAQLDGYEKENEGVLILAATNMPWDVDSAMKRPGRFSRQIFVPPPDKAARAEMFALKLADTPCEAVDYQVLGDATELHSGADIDGIIDGAKEAVLAEIITSGNERRMTQPDLLAACEQAIPSTLDWLRTAQNLVRYGGADRSYRDVDRYLKSIKFK